MPKVNEELIFKRLFVDDFPDTDFVDGEVRTFLKDPNWIITPDGEYCEVIEAPAIEYSDGRKVYLNGTYGDMVDTKEFYDNGE